MKTLSLLGNVILISLLFVSCTLNNESSTNCAQDLTGDLSTTESEFVGSWVLTDLVSDVAIDLTDDGVDNPSTEIFDQLSECSKDLVYDFNSNRSFTVKQEYNAVNCDNKLSIDGTWRLIGAQLTLVSLCQAQQINIQLNNEYTMYTLEDTYNFNDVTGNTINTDVTLTYTKTL